MMRRIPNATLVYIMIASVLIMLAPFGISSYYWMGKQTQLANDNRQHFLQNTLREKKQETELYYQSVEKEMEWWIQAEAYPFLSGGGPAPVWKENKEINAVYLFDAGHNTVYSSTGSPDRSVEEELKNKLFSAPWMIGDFVAAQEGAKQRLFYKLPGNGGHAGYFVCELNNTRLMDMMKTDGSYTSELYNNTFDAVAGSDPARLYKRLIQTVTKRMLDGNTGYEKYGQNWYAYTFVSLDDQPLYLMVYQNEAAPLRTVQNQRLILIILFVFFLFIALFMAWKIIKKVQKLLAGQEIGEQEKLQHLVRQALLEKEERIYGMLHGQLHHLLSAVTRKLGALRQEDREFTLVGYYQNIFESLESYVAKNNQTRETLRYFQELNGYFLQQYVATKEQLQELRQDIGKAQTLLDEHIGLGRMDEGVDVHSVWEDARAWLLGSMKSDNIRILRHFEPVPRIAIQKDMLEKVFRGIMENAFTAIHGKRLIRQDDGEEYADTLSVTCQLGAHNQIQMEFTDSGGGIKNEMRVHYFSPDYSKKQSGDSLSLYQIDRFLNQTGGKISLKNVDGGLCVTIHIPAQ